MAQLVPPSAGEAAVQQLADALREEMMVAMLNAMQNTASMLADIASQHLSELRQVMLAELAEQGQQAALQSSSPPRGGALQYVAPPAVAVAALEEPQKRPSAQPQQPRVELTLPDSDEAKDIQSKPPSDEFPSDAAADSIPGLALTSPAPTESTRASNSEALPRSPESSDATPSAGESTWAGLPAGEPAAAPRLSPIYDDDEDASGEAAAPQPPPIYGDEASNNEAASTSSRQREAAEASEKGGAAAAADAREPSGQEAVPAEGAQETEVAESGDAATGDSPRAAVEKDSSSQTRLPDAVATSGSETTLPSVPAAEKPGTFGGETSSGSSSATSGGSNAGNEGTCLAEAGGGAGEEAGPVQRSPANGRAVSTPEVRSAASSRRRGWSMMLEKAGSSVNAAADCPQSRGVPAGRSASMEVAHESEAVQASPLLARTLSLDSGTPYRSPEPCEPEVGESVKAKVKSGNVATPSPEDGKGVMFTMMSDSEEDAQSANSDDDFISRGWNEWETVDKERQARERLEKRLAAASKGKAKAGGRRGREGEPDMREDEEEEEEDEEGEEGMNSEEEEREAARKKQAELEAARPKGRASEMVRVCMSCRRRASEGRFGDPPSESTRWYCNGCWAMWNEKDARPPKNWRR